MDTNSAFGEFTAARVQEIINSERKTAKRASLSKITEKLEETFSREQKKLYLNYEKELVSFVYNTYQKMYICGMKDRMPPL